MSYVRIEIKEPAPQWPSAGSSMGLSWGNYCISHDDDGVWFIDVFRRIPELERRERSPDLKGPYAEYVCTLRSRLPEPDGKWQKNSGKSECSNTCFFLDSLMCVTWAAMAKRDMLSQLKNEMLYEILTNADFNKPYKGEYEIVDTEKKE